MSIAVLPDTLSRGDTRSPIISPLDSAAVFPSTSGDFEKAMNPGKD